MDPSPPDHDVATALARLTSSVQELINLLKEDRREDTLPSRDQLKSEQDEVHKALKDERENGRPTELPDWEETELLSPEAIEEELRHRRKTYQDLWAKLDTSTEEETKATADAYQSAFRRFSDIHLAIGWRLSPNPDADVVLFDEASLTAHRDALLSGIFAHEAQRMHRTGDVREPSRARFEYSRLPRLLAILIRLDSRQHRIAACGSSPNKAAMPGRPFDAPTVLSVLVEMARRRPERELPRAHEADLSIDSLLRHCYARRILVQPAAGDLDAFHAQCQLLWDCLTALDFTARFREIRHPLCLRFFVRHRTAPILRVLDFVRMHDALTRGTRDAQRLRLEESASPTFEPDEFSVEYLREFGGLSIEWTECLDEHLTIDAARNAVYVFAHPTFFYNGHDLQRSERDFFAPVYHELATTYALLFRPSSYRGRFALKRYRAVIESKNLPWHKCMTFLGRPIQRPDIFARDQTREPTPNPKPDINPVMPPSRDILENFWRCSLPPTSQAAYGLAETRSIRATAAFDQHRVTSAPMNCVRHLAVQYPEDLTFMMMAVFETALRSREAFVRFPYFGPRLRQLKTWLDTQRPQTLRQVWKDRRDLRMRWAFCSVMAVAVVICVELAMIYKKLERLTGLSGPHAAV